MTHQQNTGLPKTNSKYQNLTTKTTNPKCYSTITNTSKISAVETQLTKYEKKQESCAIAKMTARCALYE